MTTEEKARAYDMALKKARKKYNSKYHPSVGPSGVYLNNADLEEIFPELAESEDERIRKDLVNLIGWLKANPKLCSQYYNDRYDKALAYLEKQKENPDRLILIGKAKSEKQVVLLAESNGDENIYWDTKSEEDAVSLLEKGLKFFGKQKEQKSTEGDNETEIQKAFREGKSAGRKEVFDHPKEYGLQKEQKPDNPCDGCNNYKGCINCVDGDQWAHIVECKPAEWSEEDEDKMTFLEKLIEHNVPDDEYGFPGGRSVTKSEAISMLKSLRPQSNTVSVENATKFGDLEYERGVKDGIQSEKSHQWKPNEEQMGALFAASERNDKLGAILNSLYNDLQKL